MALSVGVMSCADLDAATQAALAAYVDALYAGASEFVALYAAVTAWLTYHPGTLVDDARRTIAALVGAPSPTNVVPFRNQV
jgi:hypothetical protein